MGRIGELEGGMRPTGGSLALGALLIAGLCTQGCIGEMGPPPLAADCQAKTSRSCFCSDDDIGIQTCSDEGDAWTPCRCSCRPGEVVECSISLDEPGMRSCDASGVFWHPCQRLEDFTRREAQELAQDPRCSMGEAWCEDLGCVSLANSAENCGACGRGCEGCDRCIRGECTTVCCDFEANCGTEWNPICSDLESDSANCGFCGNECSPEEICVEGGCR